MDWTELLKVGLLLVDVAQTIAAAHELDPAAFAAKRLEYESERAALTSEAKNALAMLIKAKA